MLHPEARRAVDRAAAEPAVSTPGYDLEAHRARARSQAATEPREDVAEVRDLDAGGVPVRVHVPAAARGGVVVHLHGGGFVFNDVEVHDAAARRLANRTGSTVVSVDYRLAPEHPHPAAVEDVDAVLGWLATEGPAAGLAGLDGPVLAHGDSAGANLALVAARRNPGRFAALALIYPFLDPARSGASHATETEGFAPEDVAWYWDAYAGGDHDRFHDPDLAPLRAPDFTGLPPTLVATAEHDPLCSEGEELAARMAADGVPVVATRHLGQVHGFWRHPGVFPAAGPLERQVAAFWDAARGRAAG